MGRKKAKINFAKHKVTFEEARTVFYDEDEIIRVISSRQEDDLHQHQRIGPCLFQGSLRKD